jgi:probable addiction module antidote protein
MKKNKNIEIEAEKLEVTDFNEDFVKRLKNNPKFLKSFVRETIKQYEKDDDFGMFLEAIKTVAIATEGMTKISKKTNVKRDTLYKAFSQKGNPEAKTYFNVLKNVGIQVHYSYAEK